MQQSPTWEAYSHSPNQEILRLLRKPKVHFRVYKSPPLVHILIHPIQFYFLKLHSDITSRLRLVLPCGLFP